MPRSAERGWWREPLPEAAALSALAVALAWYSWRTWPDPLVDYGQQLYVAWRVAEGDVLYRDVAYLHGPLSALSHGLLMRVFGTSMSVIVWFNLAVVAVVSVLIHRLVRAIADRCTAIVGTAVFLTLFAFAQYLRLGNYNWVCPYTYEITHGVALILLALWGVKRGFGGRARYLALAGLATGLALLTKFEVVVAGVPAILFGVAAGSRGRRGLAPLVAFVAGMSAPVLLAWLYFLGAYGPGDAVAALLTPYLLGFSGEASGLLLYRHGMGLDEPAYHIGRLILTALAHAVGFGGLALLAARLAPRPGAIGTAVAFAAPVLVLIPFVTTLPWTEMARPLPLAMPLVAIACARRPLSDRRIVTLAVTVFATLLLAKMILNTRIYHYGFALALPATLVWLWLVVYRVPMWIRDRRGWDRGYRAAVAGILLVAALGHLHNTLTRQRYRDLALASGGDRILASDNRATAMNVMLELIETRAGPDDTLTVFPDGIMLNYLARRKSPVPYLNYMPTDVVVFGEETIAADLERFPPDWIVLADIDASGHGARYFGRDYATRLGAFVRENYAWVGTAGETPLTGRGFGLALFARRP